MWTSSGLHLERSKWKSQLMAAMDKNESIGNGAGLAIDKQGCLGYGDLFIELAVLMMIHEAVFNGFVKRKVLKYFQAQHYWDELKLRRGCIMPTVQEEVINISVCTAHHLVGGFAMLAGFLCANPFLFQLGAVFETAFEVLDLISLFKGRWPYDNNPNADLKALMIVHHIPGLSCTIPMIANGWHANPHAQLIGAWLLLAGGFAGVALIYQHTLDIEHDIEAVLLLNLVNSGFVFYGRFWMFPVQAWELVLEVKEHSMAFAWLIGIGVMLMTLFNLKLCYEMGTKTVKYLKLYRKLKLV